MRKPLVKDMSQQASNRFWSLKVEDTCTSVNKNLDSPSYKDQDTQTMSETPPPDRIYIRSLNTKLSTHIEVQLQTMDTGVKIGVIALLDSGATGLFIDRKFVEENHLNTRKLSRAIPVYNVDGTLNQGAQSMKKWTL